MHIEGLINYIESHNGQPPTFYKGNKPYRNSNNRLPNGIYKTYRVYSNTTRSTARSTARLVVSDAGIWYYTPNHYGIFIPI